MTSEKSKRRQKVKILQITRDSFPSAIRVVKEGLSFHNNGYKSAVLCTPKKDQPDYEVWEGIELFRPKILRDRSFFDKLLSETSFLVFVGIEQSIR